MNRRFRTLALCAVGLILLYGLLILSRYNYLLFHTLSELFSIAVAWSVFLLVWNVRRFMQNDALFFLGISYLFIGSIDLFHTLAFKGMHVFQTMESANLATQLWISARGLEAGALVLFGLLLGRRFQPALSLSFFIGATALLLASIFVWDIFPECYREGMGLTSFKIGAEYVICFLTLVALVLLHHKRNQLDTTVYHYMVAAMVLTMTAEVVFTSYVRVYGISNLIGHYLKILSFFFVYMGLIRSGLSKPFAILFKELSQEKDALRASREEYRITFNSIGEGILETDINGRIVRMNPVAQQLTGWNLEEAQDRDFSEVFYIVNAHTRERCENPIYKVLAYGQMQGLANDTILIAKDGTEYQIADSCSPVLDGAGHISGVVLVFRDVTETYNVQEALRESERRYRLLFENAANAVALYELIVNERREPVDYLLLEVNPAFEVHTGIAAPEVVGRRVTEVFPGPDTTSLIESFGQVVRTGEAQSFEHYFKPLQRYFLINAYKVAENQFATVFRDITSRKQVEAGLHQAKQQAEEASKAKSDFLAKMSHEIRTPMNSILGMLRMVLAGELPSKQRERIRVAMDSADSLLWLLNDLLDLSKIESGRFDVQEKEFNPHRLMQSVVKEMELLAADKGLSLSQSVDSDLPAHLIGDPQRLRRILINLLSNAIKYTEQGWIRIKARQLSVEPASGAPDQLLSTVVFEVQDTGQGIDPENRETIFESYERKNGDFLSPEQGTGLGLAICKKLSQQMGGRIWVESEPGKGSTFCVQIPFQTDGKAGDQEVTKSGTERESWGDLSSLRILLVEDQKMNQLFTIDLLSSEGHEVEVAEDGLQALEQLGTKSFDLVLMDIKMPNMDGIEATKRIRTSDPVIMDPDIPIIALSAHVAPQEEYRRFQEAGFNEYVVKPVSFEKLFAAMSSVLEVQAS